MSEVVLDVLIFIVQFTCSGIDIISAFRDREGNDAGSGRRHLLDKLWGSSGAN